jgi:DNA-binding CsgD family transcriptional regulator
MSTVFARCLGLVRGQQITADAAVILVERRSDLALREAWVLVFDYLGLSRGQICEELEVSVETVRTYWRRIRQKTGCHKKQEVRAWLEELIRKEMEGELQH